MMSLARNWRLTVAGLFTALALAHDDPMKAVVAGAGATTWFCWWAYCRLTVR